MDKHTAVLQIHIDTRANKQSVKPTNDGLYLPYSTVSDYIQRLAAHEVTTGEKITVAVWVEQNKKKQGSTLFVSKEVRNRKQTIVVAREGHNTPMLQKHLLKIFESVAGCTRKQADNYDQHVVD